MNSEIVPLKTYYDGKQDKVLYIWCKLLVAYVSKHLTAHHAERLGCPPHLFPPFQSAPARYHMLVNCRHTFYSHLVLHMVWQNNARFVALVNLSNCLRFHWRSRLDRLVSFSCF